MNTHDSAGQGSDQPEANASTELLLAIVGSICGVLITGALDTSPTGRLIGAALGSVVPILITFAGPWRRLRVGVGIATAVLALFITYSGVYAFDQATDREATFPLPGPVPSPNGDGNQGDVDDDGTERLTVTIGGAGSGTVTTSNPPDITCPGTCEIDVPVGVQVVLTASAEGGSNFAGWSGDCGVDPCTVTMDTARSVTATFDPVGSN